MKTDLSEEDEDNILYELLIHTEWALEPEIVGDHALSQGGSIFYRTLKHTQSNLWSLASNILNSFWSRSSVPPDLARILNSGSEWQLGVGAQGAVIAILQDSSLEIRAKKDEYASVVGKNLNLYNDPFPKRRKVAWSSECSMVAVAYSNGVVEIFNTVGASLFTIYPPKFQEDKLQVDANMALAALIFSDVRTEKIKWAAELIMIDFFGNVRGYFVSPTEGYQESNCFSFHRLYPQGISAAAEIGSLIIVSGACQFINDPSLRSNGLGHGLSIWRMLNDYPFYKQVPTIDEEEYTPPISGFFSHVPKFKASPHYDSIFRLCISPLGRQVAALHSSGGISIWDVPSLRKRKFWSLENQPGFDMQNYDLSVAKKATRREIGTTGNLKNNLVDVKWWSEKAVILARFSGAVTICSIHSLTNLLGESPEFFEGVPQISETYDRCFLGLEMERNLVRSHSKSLANVSESSTAADCDETTTDDVDFFDEADMPFMQKWKLLTLGVLFWITDIERFRPLNKRPKVIARTCRLLCLKSTTPMELFTRKIENEEYGEALAIAQRYNLDCDLVYQQQWRKNPVTVATIQDYLTKIRKRSWVLAECLSRVPDDIDAARELILYGLRGTELDTLVGIDEGTNQDEFLVSDLSMEYEEDPTVDPEEAEREAQEWAANDLKLRKELLSKINFHDLSVEQIEVVRARQILLKYYDRLSSYEVMLGGPHVAPERYDPLFYEKFRNQTELEAAVEMARDCNWQGVEVLFTYHGETTLLHRLPILSSFPPTIGPFEYRSLLPECDLSEEVFEWEEDSLRDPDWCEDPLCRKAVGVDPDVGLTLLYDESPHLEKFGEVELTAELVSEWYKERAKEIEKNSHFVDAAADLLKLAKERNCQGLEELQHTFDTLEVLVYEVGLSDLTLEKFETLSDLEKFKLLMSTSTSETHIQNVRRWGLAFVNHCEEKEEGVGKRLLRDYIISTSTQDLSIAFKTIQHSQQDTSNPILSSSEEVLKVALDSIYECEKETQLPRAFAILECLPVRDSIRDSKELSELHNLVDDLEDHLSVAELLSSHGILVTPSFIKKAQNDEAQIKLLLTRLARMASRRETSMTDEDWNKLLNDMLEMQQKVFCVVEPQICFEILTEALLTSGVRDYIDFAGELMNRGEGGSPVRNPYLQKLPYSTSKRLIIRASTEYFNSSESSLDKDMVLARYCLNMMETEDEDISAELDLITSLEILPDIGIHKLPLQVRLCEERLKLIEGALDNEPENYKMGNQILRLAYLLRVCGDDERTRRAKVTTLIAEAAFRVKDYEAASSWCLQLVKGGYGEGWNICALLGKCSQSPDFSLKAKLLDFALTHCSSEYLEELLYIRTEVELNILYSGIGDRIDINVSNVSLDSDDGFEDARAESDEESCEEFEDSVNETPSITTFGTKRLLLNVTKDVLSATAASTSTFVSTVANKRLWKNALGWLRPLKGQSSKSGEEENDEKLGNKDFLNQGTHGFYADLIPQAHISLLGPSYKSFAPVSFPSTSLEVSFTLLRIALIERNLHQSTALHSNATVFQEVAKEILKEDLLAGISFLEHLSSPHEVHQVFSELPRTEISLQVFLYYYALQIYTYLYPWENPSIPPVFFHSPNDVINCIRTVIKRGLTADDEDIMSYVEYFQDTDQMISDYIQGQALHKLNAGVDIERFLSEPEYKKDTVLGLAMTSDHEVIDLSITLARKYDVDLWEVYMTHLQYLFDSPDISEEELQSLIQERSVISCLKQNPQNFLSAMEKNVLPTISGKDHDKMIFYFSLILQVSEDDEMLKETAEFHINLLKEIKEVAPTLDYHILLNPNADTLQVLKPVLTSENVDTLARIAQTLSKKEESTLESSMVYCAWAQKHFFTPRGGKKPKTKNDWIKRFSEMEDILKKMKPREVLLLIKNCTFSEEAVTSVPLEARRDIIQKAALHSKTKSENTKCESESSEWMETCNRFEKLENHLKLLRSETFKRLENHSDPRLRDYAYQFVLSGGDESALENLARKVLVDLCSFQVLQSVLAVYPEDALQVPEDVFSQVLNMTLDNLKKFSEDSEEAFEKDFKVLAHILGELEKYCEGGGELLDPEEVLDEIRAFGRNEENSLLVRVRALSEAQKFLPFNEEDERLLQAMKTGDIVREAFSSPAKGSEAASRPEPMDSSDKIDTEEGREELLQTLIDKMDSVKKAQSILQLLKIWPDFKPEVYSEENSNPLLRVFLKLLNDSKLKKESSSFVDFMYSSTKEYIRENKISSEAVSILVQQLLDTPSSGNLKCALKIALAASHSSAQKEAFEKYKISEKVQEEFYDEDLFKLIIEKKAVPEVLPTALYGPFVTYLSEDGNARIRKSVVDQLEVSNHWLEAASFSMFCSSVPRSLRTASTALKTFSKWL